MISVDLDGVPELNRKLAELTKAAERAALRRSLDAGARIYRDALRARAPKDTGELRSRIGIASKAYFGSGQRRVSKVERYVGILARPFAVQAAIMEFGAPAINVAPQPYLRPAWNAVGDAVEAAIAGALGKEIDRAAARLAARRARLAARG